MQKGLNLLLSFCFTKRLRKTKTEPPAVDGSDIELDQAEKSVQVKMSGCNHRIESISMEILETFDQSFLVLQRAWELHASMEQTWTKVQRQLSVYNGIEPDEETKRRCQSCLDQAQIGGEQAKVTLSELENICKIVFNVLPGKEELMNFLQRHSKGGRHAISISEFASAYEDLETICKIVSLQDQISLSFKRHFDVLNAFYENILDENEFELADKAVRMTENRLSTSSESLQIRIAEQVGYSNVQFFVDARKTSISARRMKTSHLFAFVDKIEQSRIMFERVEFLRSSQFTRQEAHVAVAELEQTLKTARQDLKTSCEPAHTNSDVVRLVAVCVMPKETIAPFGDLAEVLASFVPKEFFEDLMKNNDDILPFVLFKSFPKDFDKPMLQDLVSEGIMSHDQFVTHYKNVLHAVGSQSANGKPEGIIKRCAEMKSTLNSYLKALSALTEAEGRFSDADYAYSKRRSKEAKDLFVKSTAREYDLVCR